MVKAEPGLANDFILILYYLTILHNTKDNLYNPRNDPYGQPCIYESLMVEYRRNIAYKYYL